MKLTEKISWLIGRVQRSLFPHLNEWLPPSLTEKAKRLVSILEIVQVERYVPRLVTRYRYPGRKPLDRQVLQTAEEAIGELPTVCDRGTKQNVKGHKTSWNGYKLHLDTNDIGRPISALVTSVSLHDSQVAIPLIKRTLNKVTYLYNLMDAAYDAQLIAETSRKFGHVSIADRNGRGTDVVPMAPHKAERYKIHRAWNGRTVG